MKIVNKKITDLIEAEYNPRRLTEDQHKQLKDSLLTFGIVDPVLINTNKERENIIIGGHQRTKVWQELGNDTIPCVELDLSIDKEKELNIRLNKNTGQFDFDLLDEFFDKDKLIEFGFQEHEFSFEVSEDVEEEKEEKDLSGTLKETFEIIIECDNEGSQEETYNKIIKEGYICRVLKL